MSKSKAQNYSRIQLAGCRKPKKSSINMGVVVALVGVIVGIFAYIVPKLCNM